MHKPQNRWPTTPISQDIMFVAQTFRELLSDQASISFRAPTHESISRAEEVIWISKDIIEKSVSFDVVASPVKELASSLKADPIFRDKLQEQREVLERLIKKDKFTRKEVDFSSGFAKFLIDKFSASYPDELMKFIVDNYRDKRKWSDIRSACASFVSYLRNIGCSDEFLRLVVNEKFFTQNLSKLESRTLRNFLRRFPTEEKKFITWTKCGPKTGNFLRKLNLDGLSIVGVKKVPKDVSNALSLTNPVSSRVYASQRSLAMDRYAAAQQLSERLLAIKSTSVMFREEFDLEWSNWACARKPRESSVQRIEFGRSQIPRQSVSLQTGKAARLRFQARAAFMEFDGTSSERLQSSLGMALLADEQLSPENRLVSLWSAMEVLLGHVPEGVRILHYKELLVPALCSRYARGIAASILATLQREEKALIGRLLGRVECPSESNLQKFVRLMVLKENASLEKQLFQSIHANSLLKFRIWEFREYFAKPAPYLDKYKGFEEKVGWQVERIYRARNSLVHAGIVSPQIRMLSDCLAEYFQKASRAIVARAAKSGSPSEIDVILVEMQIAHEVFKNRLKRMRGRASFEPSEIVDAFGW